MRIVFRVDADHKIGMGHLVRCLALAAQLKQKIGAEITFVTSTEREVRHKVEQAGYGLAVVSSKFDLPSDLKGDIILTEIRDTELPYMQELRTRGQVLVTFDDLGQGRYAADLVVDANLDPEEDQDRLQMAHLLRGYPGWRNGTKLPRYLLGPDYIILREDFTRLADQPRKINPAVKKILVSMGGSDPNNLTAKVLQALSNCNSQSAIQNPPLEVDVVIGPAFESEKDFRDYLGQTRNLDFRFRRGVTAIHNLMWEADLAIASAGVTMYELACCGTPAVILAQDSVQVKNTRPFSKAGAIVNLGVGTQVKEAELARVIMDLISDESTRWRMSKAGRCLVDGRGLSRVIKEIERRRGE
ncbi:MAG: UDP-2,4-diacetamido-2,4,6-trideoxy-beta-L-altropyranose hydrolase [bacterium]